MAKVTKDTYLYWYELMYRLRRFEERAGMLYGQQKIRGFCHLYIGQEAVAAGTVTALRQDDRVITAYRDHGLGIAKGISRLCTKKHATNVLVCNVHIIQQLDAVPLLYSEPRGLLVQWEMKANLKCPFGNGVAG